MDSEARRLILATIRAVAPGLSYGSVAIIVHDGKPKRVRVESETLFPDESSPSAKPPPRRPA